MRKKKKNSSPESDSAVTRIRSCWKIFNPGKTAKVRILLSLLSFFSRHDLHTHLLEITGRGRVRASLRNIHICFLEDSDPTSVTSTALKQFTFSEKVSLSKVKVCVNVLETHRTGTVVTLTQPCVSKVG